MLDYSSITLLIDLDDTIEDLLPAWISWLNKKYNTSVSPSDVASWDIQTFFPTLTSNMVYQPLYINEFWKTVKPKKMACKYIKKLQKLGFKIYICTTSNFKTIYKKLIYIINRYFPFISWDQVIITSNKQMLNADILIDDGLHNLIGGSYKKILMNAPHNKNTDINCPTITRVDNWKEAFVEILKCGDQIIKEKTEEK